jgi:hypothetical protein
MSDTKKEQKILMYKGKPLVRQGNVIYYGSPEDKAILYMNVLESQKVGDLNVATKVLVQIQKTGKNVPNSEKVIKQCEKKSFYDAFDIGIVWLERELRPKADK